MEHQESRQLPYKNHSWHVIGQCWRETEDFLDLNDSLNSVVYVQPQDNETALVCNQ